MSIATTTRPASIEEALARPCGCGALAWACLAPYGRIGCAECGAWYSRPCGLPAPQPAAVA